jgi:hypothetical protein
MAKFQSPLLGYNNNVRYKGKVFHIQTEDSGAAHPHVITHLFMDGGRILKSVKKSYAEHVGSDGQNETVRALMKEQHKAMFTSLREGAFDHLLDLKPAKPAAAPPKETVPPPTDVSPPMHFDVGPTPEAELEPARLPDPAELVFTPQPMPAIAAPPETDQVPAPTTDDAPTLGGTGFAATPAAAFAPLGVPLPEPAFAHIDAPDEASPRTERRHQSAEELTLDFDALDRDLASGPVSSVPNLPPPPANLFAKNEVGTGKYRSLGVSEERAWAPPSSKAPRTVSDPSIFGDEVVSDQSLDEVILSYLAEDLDPSSRK